MEANSSPVPSVVANGPPQSGPRDVKDDGAHRSGNVEGSPSSRLTKQGEYVLALVVFVFTSTQVPSGLGKMKTETFRPVNGVGTTDGCRPCSSCSQSSVSPRKED